LDPKIEFGRIRILTIRQMFEHWSNLLYTGLLAFSGYSLEAQGRVHRASSFVDTGIRDRPVCFLWAQRSSS
jgi:hypothetical protein